MLSTRSFGLNRHWFSITSLVVLMTLLLPSMGWANSCSEVFKKYDSQFYSFDEVTRQQVEWRENSSGYPNINFSKIDIRPPRSIGEKEVFLDLSIRQRVNTGLNNG